MKKNLLLLASLAVAFGASAQVETIFFDSTIVPEKTTVDGGTVLGQGEAGTFKVAYTDDWGPQSIAMDNYNAIRINGVDLGKMPSGIGGSTNPAGWSTSTAATGGAVFLFEAAKDGYVTIPSKFSSNKNYWAFEGLAGEGELCLSYTLAIEGVSIGQPIVYTLPADAEGYLNLAAADIEKYVDGTSVRWPEKIAFGADAADIKKNGFGVVMFPVYAGCKYLFGAQGSKMITCGAIFTTEKPSVTLYGIPAEGEDAPAEFAVNYPGADTSAIESIITDQTVDENAPIYNVMGQRVTKEYKGILIQNGKKFVNF